MKPGTTIINSHSLVVRIAPTCADGRYRCTIMRPHATHHKTFSEADLQKFVSNVNSNNKSARSSG